MCRVDVRHKSNINFAIRKCPQRFHRHGRPEIGAPNADVDHRTNTFSGIPHPFPGVYQANKLRHALEYRLNAGHHVHPVFQHGMVTTVSQGRMQHGAVFGDVDAITAQHGVAGRFHLAGPGQGQQQRHGFACYAVL